MYYKLNTRLKKFSFNSLIQKSTFIIDWFRYDLDEKVEENIRPFFYKELELFESFVVEKIANFSGDKQYQKSNTDECPIEVMDDLISGRNEKFPECFIIKPEPTLLLRGKSANYVQILLLHNEGKNTHTYKLPFGVIGKIVV